MELADYHITVVHTKGSNNIVADAIHRLNIRYIQGPIEDP